MRQNISSGSPWEDIIGYSRAVKIGNVVEISGTTASSDNGIVGKNDLYTQTKFILEKVNSVLAEAGASMQHVVRTRMFLTNISQWEQAAKAHGQFFKTVKPVTTMVEVSNLIDADMLIEIEVTAIIS
ncbi:MAG: RidA family protein [Sphingobacteriales bacterium]|nr:MAG: RidA family protein [Sphingobacteriales bacterium]TAF79788.1 MAG: RidA family protein [Sphingobacteriales bacterium]